MVKTFKRSDAGKGEQLPSDLRPPAVLKQTCDYLFNKLLADAPNLGQVHLFLWDRTRAIRNDFSIQQVTKLEDVRLAVECYERMARFHIASLHQCATAERPYEEYSPAQEREQLDKTLLSLMQYYDDNRHRLELPNEPEFRAYCVIFQLQAPEPNLEDRVQSWPRKLAQDPRVQIALKIYAAACSTARRGPFKNYTTNPVIARQDWEHFWKLIVSSQVSYLMACVAEIHFGVVRDMVLKSIVRTSRVGKTVNGRTSGSTDWTMDDLWNLLNFDEEDQLVAFCEQYGLYFQNRDDDGKAYLDLGSMAGKTLQSPTPPPGQIRTKLVDDKRHGRMLPAIIDGLSVGQARAAGLIRDDVEDDGEMGNAMEYSSNGHAEEEEDMDSLFVPEARKPNEETKVNHGFSAGVFGQASNGPTLNAASTFGQPSGSIGGSKNFKQPSNGSSQGTTTGFGQATQPPPALNFNQVKPAAEVKPSPFSFAAPKPAEEEKPSTFNFLSAGTTKPAPTPATGPSVFGKSSSSQTPASGGPASGGLFSTSSGKDGAQSSPFSFAQPTTSSAPSLFAPKSADANAATDNPFKFPSAAAPSALPKPTNSGFTFAPSTEPAASAPAPTIPSGLGTAPSAPSGPATSDTNLNSAPSPQIQFTAPTPPSSSQTPAPIAPPPQDAGNNALGAASRRSSIASLPDTKPKKPSPLSNSFTSFDDGGASSGATFNGLGAGKTTPQELFPDKQSTEAGRPGLPTKPLPVPAQPPTEIPDFDSILTRLADELTHDSVVGFLKQYVEFDVKRVITTTQERLYRERVNKEADDFRTWFLQDKFGKRWRETCRRQRLAKQGRERRKRAQRRLHESQRSDTLDNGSIAETASISASSVTSPARGRTQSKREKVDAMYQSALGDSLFRSDRQAQAGSLRLSASITSDAPSSPRTEGHKWKKSTSHVDDHGRVSKPHSSSDVNADILRRSSFLNFSLASNASHRGSTTKSPYFRMKALGMKANIGTSNSRGVKRQRGDSIESGVATPPPRKRPSPPVFAARESIEDKSMGPPSARSVQSRVSDDDEALFARLKAARDSLKESGTFMRSEVEKESDLRRSVGSASDSESPSLLRARAEARARAYQADSDFGASVSGRDVPAYRNRESRFVPREHYARAIERANDLRASRSADMSRSTSGAGQLASKSPAQNNFESEPRSQPVQTRAFGSSLAATTESGYGNLEVAPSGLISRPVENEHSASHISGSGAASFDSFNQVPMQAPTAESSFLQGHAVATDTTFENNSFQTTAGPRSLSNIESNPFLQTTTAYPPFNWHPPGDTGDSRQQDHSFAFGTNGDLPQDQTVPPSQINEVLSHSFGPAPTKLFDHDSPAPDGYDSTTTPFSNSYMPSQAASQAISLLSDGEDDEPADEQTANDNDDNDVNMNVYDELAASQSRDPSSDNHASDSFTGPSYSNKFAALADEDEDESDEMAEEVSQQNSNRAESDSGSGDSDLEDNVQRGGFQYNNDDVSDRDEFDENESEEDTLQNGHEYYDEEGDGEDRSDEEDDADREGSYDEEEEESYDEEDEDDHRPSGHFGSLPPFGHAPAATGNPALQVVGNNVEEAIELSD
jgi:hypothetical protein